MQNRKELNVDVHTRAIRASERISGNGKLQAVIDAPHLKQAQWWRKFFRWEPNLTVAGRTIEKGWVVPQPLGIALLVVILGGVGSLYWRITDRVDAIGDKQATEMQTQREMLIRLDQRLIDKNERDREKFEQMEKRFQNTDAVQIVLGRDIVKLQANKR